MTDRVRTITIDEFHQAVAAQGALTWRQAAYVCPMCGTVQDSHDLVAAGLQGADRIEAALGFNCVGRYTGAGSPRKEPDGKPCNWTLGGLFRTHRLEVVDASGTRHPHFEVATREQAEAHRAARQARKGTQA